MKAQTRRNKGFTLIEILIVIGIIAILAAVVIVAINPARQFAQANDSQRSSNVNTLLNAIHQYGVDFRGALPPGIAALAVDTSTEICGLSSGCPAGTVAVPELIANQTYIAEFPHDPQCNFPAATTGNCAANGIGYFVARSSNGRITVDAPFAQLASISVTR